MAHTLFDNVVLQNTVADLMNTKLDLRSLFSVDDTLVGEAGLKVTVNKYTYTGSAEQLASGAKNTASKNGAVSFTGTTYEVKRYQHTAVYNDMDLAKDPMVLDVITKGMAETMANEVKDEYFTELAKISNEVTFAKNGSLSYDTIVDALATIGCEAEEGTFIIMGTDCKKMIRKDSDFKAAQQGEILYTGQFGSIAGVPVIFSKKVPAKTCYITSKDAIKFFVKKEVNVETDRDVETKDNTIVAERIGYIALVDDSKSVKITEATTTTTD